MRARHAFSGLGGSVRVDVDGAAVSVAAHGPAASAHARPALFLHGAGMDGSAWALQAPLLGGKGVAALVPDLPGHGRSGGAPLATVDDLAAFVWRLADALGLGRVALVGHSLGALAALAAAAADPDRAERVALLGAALAMPVNDALLAAARDEPERAAGMVAGWGLGRRGALGGGGLPGASLGGGVRAALGTAPPGALRAGLAACDAYAGGPAAAARVAAPTLVLSGAEDRMAPPGRGRELADAVPGAAFALVPRAGHMLMLEAPDAVTRALLGFLLPPRASARAP